MKRGDDPINPQKELLALWGTSDAPALREQLAAASHDLFTPEDILAHELYLVSAEQPEILGAEHTLYASPRIDNLANAYAATCAIRDCQPTDHIAIFISYQHEEIGSHTRQGAAASLLSRTLARIAEATNADLRALLAESVILSCDQPTPRTQTIRKSRPCLASASRRRPVLKLAASHSYATTPRGEAMLRASAPKKTSRCKPSLIAQTCAAAPPSAPSQKLPAASSHRRRKSDARHAQHPRARRSPRSGRHGTIDGRIFHTLIVNCRILSCQSLGMMIR